MWVVVKLVSRFTGWEVGQKVEAENEADAKSVLREWRRKYPSAMVVKYQADQKPAWCP